MGNPAWGHGYHQGFGDGAKQGSAITAAAALIVGGLIFGAKRSYGKLKERRAAQYEHDLLSQEASTEGVEGASDDSDQADDSPSPR